MYTYLLINIATILFPLVLSFDKKVAFYRNWRSLFPSILATGAIFIIWDVWFTSLGVWEFNPEYIVGWYLWGLPLEEWLFFLTVPYACVFIYECLNAYLTTDFLNKFIRPVCIGLISLLVIVGLLNIANLYTSITFFSVSLLLGLNVWIMKNQKLGHFFRAYGVSLIPFAIVNGILTALPVVIYNDAQNLGLRLGTIPIEDSMYLLLLLLMTINMYEWLKIRKSHIHHKPQQDYV